MLTPTRTNAVTVTDPLNGMSADLELDVASVTPQQVIDHLIAEQKLVRQAPDGAPLHYGLAHGTRRLIPDEPLGAQGVKPGDSLELLTLNVKGV